MNKSAKYFILTELVLGILVAVLAALLTLILAFAAFQSRLGFFIGLILLAASLFVTLLACRRAAFLLVQELRKKGISADFDHAARSVKAQFKYAGKVGARFVVAIGSNELESGMYTIKDMAASASESVAAADAAAYLASKLQ